MPEGHTLHRLARSLTTDFGGGTVRASSPQGRFADGAALIDSRVLERVEAYGKHLFEHYDGLADMVHIHLGLYGKVTTGPQPAPQPRGALRLRLENDRVWADLRGATACELVTPAEREAVLARLGPDPLATRPNPTRALERLARTSTPIAAALMDQSVIAGVGNVYRAELLFRHRVDPAAPSRSLDPTVTRAMWDDLVVLMRAGVRSGRIVTTLPEHRSRRGGAVLVADAHYVYRRTGLPCRVCGTPVLTRVLAGRNLFWCPTCQSGDATGEPVWAAGALS